MRCARSAALAATIASLALVGVSCASDNDASTDAGTSSATATMPADDGSASGGLTATMIMIRDGEPVGGHREIDAELGDQVSITVVSDTSDEVHVHGYDVFEAVGPGASVEVLFVADDAGRFEVELEDAGTLIADVTVRG